ncbi:hypothetical protein [[Pseudomonas] boreopolis]|uniref:DUF2268 domain-containing protein n=1 Tax=Xanthomonas boreopolis TaxID=86183 RepID=A0A919F9E4_9XANT|nr:hypothetical protein GCM10009090_26100 [[Pseudomonas] boreopolis]
MKKLATCLLGLAWLLAAGRSGADETATVGVVDSDIALFWQVYDRVRAEPERDRQLQLLQHGYLDQGSPGLAAFAQAKGYDAAAYVDAIRAYPRYWDSIRPRTGLVAPVVGRVERHLRRLRQLYPGLRDASIYLEVGALRSAGTTLDDKVLIGVELAAGDGTVDTSQMPERLQRFFAGYFASRPLDNLDLLLVHEAVHTQQRGARGSLLAQAVYEGVADFVAEQVTGRLPELDYVRYGPAHDAAIRAAFRKDMAGNDYSGWLYNDADNPFGTRDLGYYVGYAICAGYYRASADRAAAIRTMIELDLADAAAVQRFVDASGYFGRDAGR